MSAPLVPVLVLNDPLATVTVLSSTSGPVSVPMLTEAPLLVTIADVTPAQPGSGAHPQFATLEW